MQRRALSKAFSPNILVTNTRPHLSELSDHLEVRQKGGGKWKGKEMEDGKVKKREQDNQSDKEGTQMKTLIHQHREADLQREGQGVKVERKTMKRKNAEIIIRIKKKKKNRSQERKKFENDAATK